MEVSTSSLYTPAPQRPTYSIDEIYRRNEEIIRTRYPEGLGLVDHIDLSRLDLTHLPPQIVLECQSAQTLNLSNNSISWLPEELKALSTLKELNISGNRGLQPNLCEFAWLIAMEGLHIIANDMGFTFVPREFLGRFTTNQLPPGHDLMDDCFTQSPEEVY